MGRRRSLGRASRSGQSSSVIPKPAGADLRYLHHVTQYGYDGIFFYTYVENCGARYLMSMFQ